VRGWPVLTFGACLPSSSASCVSAPTVDAFVACGGGQDKSGHVRKETLIKIIKQDFGLTIDIEVSHATAVHA